MTKRLTAHLRDTCGFIQSDSWRKKQHVTTYTILYEHLSAQPRLSLQQHVLCEAAQTASLMSSMERPANYL
jgi:hypothetical protein